MTYPGSHQTIAMHVKTSGMMTYVRNILDRDKTISEDVANRSVGARS